MKITLTLTQEEKTFLENKLNTLKKIKKDDDLLVSVLNKLKKSKSESESFNEYKKELIDRLYLQLKYNVSQDLDDQISELVAEEIDLGDDEAFYWEIKEALECKYFEEGHFNTN